MIQESRLLMGRCPEDGRLKEVADLLRMQSAGKGESKALRVSFEVSNLLLGIREQCVTVAVAAARLVFELDRKLGGCYCEEAPIAADSYNLIAAVKAAAPHIKYGSDWASLLMLCHDKGIPLKESQLIEIVKRTVPDAPIGSRQSLQSARWFTNRHRFPQWTQKGVSRSKFLRYWTIASAAVVHL